MGEIFRRIYYLLNKGRLQRELENDLQVHRELMSAENRRDFGNAAVIREQANDAWGWGWLERFLQDIRFGARVLRGSPGLTFTAIAVLALGIGVNVTAFNFVDIIFFRPLPVRDPQTLAKFTTQFNNGSSTAVSYPAAVFYRDHSDALASMIAQIRTQMTLNEADTHSIHTALVTGNYFSDLGISAAFGRVFTPGVDDAPDAPAVALLDYGFYQRHFGGDPGVVNRSIRINQRPVIIVGVLPPRFVGLEPDGDQRDDVWLLLDKETYFLPDAKSLTSFDQRDSAARVYGRFKPGMTLRAGQNALLPLAQELERQHPLEIKKGEHLRVSAGGYVAEFNGQDIPAFGLLAALVLLILAATCGNLGNLLLGHAVTREREIAIRLSLGATRGRILRQLITESILLAALGSIAALALSWYASRVIALAMGERFSTLNVTPDWRTAVFSFAIGMFACLIFGLPAARQLSRQRHRSARMRTIFMATQVTASCVLLVLSALLVRALERGLKTDPGFDYQHVVALDPQLYAHSYSPSAALQYTHDLEERLQQLPGVEAVATVRLQPLGNDITIQPTRAVDGSKFDVYINEVGPQFFQTMSIPLRRGRTFKAGEQDVAILSESTARRLWPGKDALQQLYDHNRKKWPVVGVVGDAHIMSIRDGNAGEAYLPLSEPTFTQSYVLIKTSHSPEDLSPLALKVARNIDPQLSPVANTLKQSFAEKVGDSVKVTSIIGAMGVMALLLAVIGLYGVVAYNVAQRTREIGIRIALGATPSGVVRNIISGFVAPLAIALAAGLALAAALSTVLRGELYGIHHLDPLSSLLASLLLTGVGVMAALIPARRALRVDPMIALRCE